MATRLRLGAQTLAISVPSDLDDRLLASVGLAAAEVARMLGRECLASTVAAALNPLLAEPMPRGELASLIAGVGTDKVRHRLHSLYQRAAGAKQKEAGVAQAEV